MKNRVYIRSCKMVLWPIRARVLFELFYKKQYNIHTQKPPSTSYQRKILQTGV